MAAYVPPKPVKKTGPAKQAEALEDKPKSQFTTGLTSSTVVQAHRRGEDDTTRVVASETPQLDEQRKAKRIQTLTDDQVLAKAKDGYMDYSVEARRRKLPGYEKD